MRNVEVELSYAYPPWSFVEYIVIWSHAKNCIWYG